jgi:hypothetical protein
VFMSALGGNPKFELSGERLRTISGGWVRDDTTELAVTSIYRAQQRWPEISVVTRDGRRGGGHWRKCLVSSHRGWPPGDGQRITAAHGDPVEVPRHVVPSRATAVTGELIYSGRKARGYDS